MDDPSLATTVTVDRAGAIVRADDGLAGLLALDPDQLVGRPLTSFGASPTDVDGVRDCLNAAAEGGTGYAQLALLALDDDVLHVQLVATRVVDETVVAVIDETDRVHEERDLASSQRRWQSLVRNAADIVFTVDDPGAVTSVTSALPARLGWQTDQVVGRTALSFVHPDDQAEARSAWLSVSRGHTRQRTLEVRLVHADQTVSWSRLVLSDLRDDADVRAVVGNATDITEQKAAELRQQQEEARFRARFDQSSVPQTMHAVDETFVAANAAFCELVGRRQDELIGRPMQWIMHPDDVPPPLSTAELGRQQGVEASRADRVLRGVDGRPIPIRADITLLRDDDGAPTGCAVVVNDLRPLRDSERNREQLQRFFDIVADRLSDFVILHDAEGRPSYASPPGLRMFGQHYNRPIDQQVELIHPDDRHDAVARWAEAQSSREPVTWRFRAYDVDDEWRWIEQRSINLLDTDLDGILSIIRDVTSEVAAQRALTTSEARYRAIAETAEEGIVVISPEGIITYGNASLAAMLGHEPSAYLGRPVWSVLDGDARDFVADRVDSRRRRGAERYELAYNHPDGTQRTLWVAASPMPDIDGEPQGSVAMISDITEQLRAVDDLRFAAQHDPLTDLPNRATLMSHLDSLDLTRHDRTALLFLDLDHFKDVNDGRGHTSGDQVLIDVANRLRANVLPGDLVARFGGDEFVVVMHDVDEAAATDAAGTLLRAVSGGYGIGLHTVRVGATIGVAMSPVASSEDLLRFADSAMYAAKASGRNRVRMFDRDLAAQTEERHVVSAELLTAIEQDELDLYYQPVIDISTGEVVGVEALARWHHPTYGEIKPDRFVALAEINASSPDIDRWVIKRALRDVSELKADLTMPDDAYVAINLSGQSLSDESLATYIVEAVEAAGLHPSDVMLEITESAIMTDKNLATTVLQRLRKRGFDIALDDFGTGYSSMAYLRDLPISVLKIDRGFIQGIPHDKHSLAIVRSLIELARSLNITVVAEGIETQAHLDALRVRGCGLGQGWLWSPAVSVETLRSSRILTDRFRADDVAIDLR